MPTGRMSRRTMTRPRVSGSDVIQMVSDMTRNDAQQWYQQDEELHMNGMHVLLITD